METRRKPLLRLRIIAGHLGAITRMIEEDRDCAEVLKQIAAVRASLSRLAKALIRDHLEECIRGFIEEGRGREEIEELIEVLASRSVKFAHR